MRAPPGRQDGLSYIEVMIATFIIAVALVPALDALQTGLRGADIHASATDDHYRLVIVMETVLAEPYTDLLNAAAAAGDATTPTAYSDAAATPGRRVVFIARYDADADPFTVPDPDLDGDADPFTGYEGLLWVRVGIENGNAGLESLAAR